MQPGSLWRLVQSATEAARAATAVHPETVLASAVSILVDVAPLPVCVLRVTLAELVTAWNDHPRDRAQITLRDLGAVKTRLGPMPGSSVRERVHQPQPQTGTWIGTVKHQLPIATAQWQPNRGPTMDA